MSNIKHCGRGGPGLQHDLLSCVQFLYFLIGEANNTHVGIPEKLFKTQTHCTTIFVVFFDQIDSWRYQKKKKTEVQSWSASQEIHLYYYYYYYYYYNHVQFFFLFVWSKGTFSFFFFFLLVLLCCGVFMIFAFV